MPQVEGYQLFLTLEQARTHQLPVLELEKVAAALGARSFCG